MCKRGKMKKTRQKIRRKKNANHRKLNQIHIEKKESENETNIAIHSLIIRQ